MSMLRGKKILLGVCGSIAAYKSVVLLRLLQKKGAVVKVIMTPAAIKFVSPLTFEAISHSPVCVDLVSNQSWNNHIELSLWADAYIIAPATAHTIGKMAHGLADDMVSATHLAARCPIFIAPSMDVDMWHHHATQANIATLKSRAIQIIPVGNGYLASGLSGEGRLAEPEEIIDYLEKSLEKNRSILFGKKIMITAGPTLENIDPVRFISNASTGKMGIAIADHMATKGAIVSLILGPTALRPQNNKVKVIPVKSALQMMEAAQGIHSDSEVCIFTAAVADYRPASVAEEKIKKSGNTIEILLVKNPDIALELGKIKSAHQIHIGFALESTSGEAYAKEKLLKKNFDMVVLNSLQDTGAGFGHDTNKTTFFFRNNKITKFELKSKDAVANDISMAIEDLISQ